jgi:hypothetical protein
MRLALGFVLLPVLALACSSSSTSGTNNNGGSNDAGTSGGDDGSSPPQQCSGWPSGKIGLMEGYVVPRSLSWQGYLAGTETLTTIKISDYYDGDGSKGINAILIDESATWCGPCNQEAPVIEQAMKGQWGPDGVRVLTLMVENANHQRADTSTALQWIGIHNLTSVDVAADPTFMFGSVTGTNGLPTNVLIDPRTMKIQKITPGFSGSPEADVDQLAQTNKTNVGNCPP